MSLPPEASPGTLLATLCLFSTITLVAGGCQVAPAGPTADVVRDGDWSMTVSVIGGTGTVRGEATFAGPKSRVRQMGMCLLRLHEPPSGTSCETADDCLAAPAGLPAGGYRYCVAPGGQGEKRCHYRAGPPEIWCAGSPAVGRAKIRPGIYAVEIAAPAGSRWLGLACFEACARIPPATSTTATVR